jgi:8-oxo-dGTP diphosphatase
MSVFMEAVNVAIGIIVRNGQVLISRRREADRFADLWEFPGGKLERDESVQEGLHRELHEELGVDVRVLGRLAPILHSYVDFRICLHPFIVELERGQPQTLASAELRWVFPGDLAQMPFPEANAGLVRSLPTILASLGLLYGV